MFSSQKIKRQFFRLKRIRMRIYFQFFAHADHVDCILAHTYTRAISAPTCIHIATSDDDALPFIEVTLSDEYRGHTCIFCFSCGAQE